MQIISVKLLIRVSSSRAEMGSWSHRRMSDLKPRRCNKTETSHFISFIICGSVAESGGWSSLFPSGVTLKKPFHRCVSQFP